MLKNLSDMSDATVLITGGLGYLGCVMAETLAEHGAEIIILDKDDAKFDILKKNLHANFGINCQFIQCNLEIEQERTNAIENLKNNKTRVSCLINNAAYVSGTNMLGWTTSFEKQSLEVWRRAIEVNLTAAFHFAQAFSPELKNEKDGNIINITSIYGQLGPDWDLYKDTQMGNPAAYSVSKGGLEQLTRWLATTLAPEVRVNAVCPGGISRNQPSNFVSRYEKRTPMKRMATENDFKGVISFLASQQSSYVTGQTINVDGGFSSW